MLAIPFFPFVWLMMVVTAFIEWLDDCPDWNFWHRYWGSYTAYKVILNGQAAPFEL